ncbi:MAG: 50S ribosomal protein L13 [Parcubacteria group bacterium]|jgi:large subunit ribosomal protein L13
MNKKTLPVKKYYLFNCEDFVLGRMATKIAFILQGKDLPDFAPNVESAVNVIVINSDKLRVSGRKKDEKTYHTYSGYPGGITSRKLKDVIERDSRQAVWNSVYGMLPKNKLRDLLMKRMLICKDENYGANIEAEKVLPAPTVDKKNN